ncbi:MAG: response regulator [Oscillochloris sp.]|nr:response regulator [Oscillochloris sp.]
MNVSVLHVLIVDDSPEDRLLVRRLLTRLAPDAYTITEVDRGGLALAACQATQPDCVLLDHNLPDMDGLEVFAALRAQSDVPVVVLTGTSIRAQTGTQPLHNHFEFLAKGTLTAEGLSLAIQRAIANVRLARTRALDLALLTMMVDAIPVGVGVLDADLRILQANATLEALLGHPTATLRGQRFAELWPDLARALAPHCAQMLATGQPAGSHAVWAASPITHRAPCVWQASIQVLALPERGEPGLFLTIHPTWAA